MQLTEESSLHTPCCFA